MDTTSDATTNTSPRKRLTCALCQRSFLKTNATMHALQTHLPWYVRPCNACWYCTQVFLTEMKLLLHVTESHAEVRGPGNEKIVMEEYIERMDALLLFLCEALNLQLGCNVPASKVSQQSCHRFSPATGRGRCGQPTVTTMAKQMRVATSTPQTRFGTCCTGGPSRASPQSWTAQNRQNWQSCRHNHSTRQ